MGYAYALSGNSVDAIESFRNSKQIRPQYLTIDSYIMHTLWMQSSLDSAELQLQRILDKIDVMTKAKTYTELAALNHFQGRFQRAREACLAGIKLCQKENKPGEESYFHYLLGEIEKDLGDIPKFVKTMDQAVNLSQSPFLEVALAGASFAQEGFKDKAMQCNYQIRSAQSLDPYFTRRKSSFENYIQGNVWMKEGAYQKAIACFRQVDKIYSGDPIYWMTQKDMGTCMGLIQDSSVILHYQNILDHFGEIFMGFLPSIRKGGFWTSRLWPELMFDLGKQYIAIQDTIQSVKYFQKAYKIWYKADPEFQKQKVVESFLEEL
jgi:tetratricopeptide (TPR) repeat protein